MSQPEYPLDPAADLAPEPVTLADRVCCVCRAHLGTVEWRGAAALKPDPAFGVVEIAPGVTRTTTHGYCDPCDAAESKRLDCESRNAALNMRRANDDADAIGGRW